MQCVIETHGESSRDTVPGPWFNEKPVFYPTVGPTDFKELVKWQSEDQ